MVRTAIAVHKVRIYSSLLTSAFPNKFIAVQFETTFATGDYPFNGSGNITWVLSNGDTTGVSDPPVPADSSTRSMRTL